VSTAGALVIGGDYRGLGIVRSLGRRGVRVFVAQDEHWLAGRSRFARGRLSWPASDEERVGFLLGLARDGLEGWAIFPTADDSAAFVARHHEELRPFFRLTTPPWETFRWAFDKRLTHQLARRCGLEEPWTGVPLDRDHLRDLACPFPAIVKPAFRAESDPFTTTKAWRADDPDTLLRRYDEASALYEPGRILVQELIPGGGEHQFSFAALCVRGEPRASVVARRARQWPTDFGASSSFVETLELPEIEEPARRLLRALEFEGLAEIEFKRDPRDGRLKLLEINARVWGWHSIGRAAGVDFPYLLWQHVRGAPVPQLRGRSGVRWVRALTDVPAALVELRAGRLSVREYARGLIGRTEFANLCWDDPLPALLEVPMGLALLRRRRTAHVLGRASRAAVSS
jgi:predicted ATP-grasp superfamily ATP-dependent carboligase